MHRDLSPIVSEMEMQPTCLGNKSTDPLVRMAKGTWGLELKTPFHPSTVYCVIEKKSRKDMYLKSCGLGVAV